MCNEGTNFLPRFINLDLTMESKRERKSRKKKKGGLREHKTPSKFMEMNEKEVARMKNRFKKSDGSSSVKDHKVSAISRLLS